MNLEAELAKQVAHRVELAELLGKQVDQVIRTIQDHLKTVNAMHDTARQLGINTGTLIPRHNLFGYLCYRLSPLFPLDMPRPRKEHKTSLMKMENHLLAGLITEQGRKGA